MYSLSTPKTTEEMVNSWRKCVQGKKDRNHYGRMIAQTGVESCNEKLSQSELEEIISAVGQSGSIHSSIMDELYAFHTKDIGLKFF